MTESYVVNVVSRYGQAYEYPIRVVAAFPPHQKPATNWYDVFLLWAETTKESLTVEEVYEIADAAAAANSWQSIAGVKRITTNHEMIQRPGATN